MNLPAPPRWWRAAACARLGVDPEIFFPNDKDKVAVEEARAICRMCPVARECLRDAMATEGRAGAAYRHGIRGTYTARERAKVYRKYLAPKDEKPRERTGGKPLSPCGTPAAYDRHIRRGEPVDDACREAHNADNRAKRERTRAKGPVVCGTRRGYQKHRRNGEEACDACRYANTAADCRLRATGSTLAAV